MQVINTAAQELEKVPGKLIVIGERGRMFTKGTGMASVNFPGIIDEERHGQAMQIRDYIVKDIFSSGFGYVKVVYPHPVSFTVQHVEVVSFLPFVATNQETLSSSILSNVIYESSSQDIIEYLTYLWMGQKLYEIFGLSRLAEFAARYVHLEESAQKLKDIDKKVKLEYFRVRHELVDRTMRELFAGRLLYAK